MTQRGRILAGLGAAVLTAIGVTLALQLIVGPDAVRAFMPVVLFMGALIGFLVWYFTVRRTSSGAISPARAVRSGLVAGGLGVWALVGFFRSHDRANDWPLVAFAFVGFVWCVGWIAWAGRRSR